MSRTTLILILVLAVVAIGGGVYLWLNKDNLSFSNTPTTNTTTNTTVSNTNSTVTNLNLSTTDTQKGDKELDQSLTVAGTSVHVSSSIKADTFLGETAPKNSTFVIVYFDGLPSTSISAVNQALKTDAHLLVGSTVVPLSGLKVAGQVVQNDRGYFKFVVTSDASNMTLEVGSGNDAQRVKLAY